MTIDKEVAALKKVPLFQGIDSSKLRLLAFISERVEFQDGESLCLQGDEGDSAFVIMEGEAQVFVDGEEVARVGQYAVVGEIAILCDVPRIATLTAHGRMSVLSISKDKFLQMLKEFPEISLEVMRFLARRLESTTRSLAEAKAQQRNGG
ncbi:cyclic nucleotide-binding domain-containing protein [Flexibacterium corallicola]|uniref:cyclic nucleotide-binding domain-containing protein n=1 Tax=Flexibacterium corallicola TaxID=3037259 RepID=UPI00286F2FB8|nr:Crp/Fnr family transcriptional regulator [Pseudovibrio sp. M1P-2-3]